MQQEAIRNAAAKSSRGTSSTQGQVAMPPEERTHQPTLVMTSPMGDQSLIAPPMLPLARPNPGKRSGSDDIERERPLRTRTPSPQARMPPRPASSQLPHHPPEERIPDGYVPRQAAEQELQLIQQRYAQETMSRSRESEEMTRGWAAMQGQQHQLAERLRECERELDRLSTGRAQPTRRVGRCSGLSRRQKVSTYPGRTIDDPRGGGEISSPRNGGHRGTGRGASHNVAGRGRKSAAK